MGVFAGELNTAAHGTNLTVDNMKNVQANRDGSPGPGETKQPVVSELKFSSEQQQQGGLDTTAYLEVHEVYHNPVTVGTDVAVAAKGSMSGKLLKYPNKPKERKEYKLHKGLNKRFEYLNSKFVIQT